MALAYVSSVGEVEKQSKSVEIAMNGSYDIVPDAGKLFDKLTVDVNVNATGNAYEEGFEEGKKAEYDAFWDAYQQNGARTDYNSAFQGAWWNDSNFKPKYDIAPVGNAANLFANSGITDLKGICERQGITLDFSQVTYSSYTFNNSAVTRLPLLDVRNIPNCANLFTSAINLESIDGIILNENGTQTFGNSTGSNWTIYSAKIKRFIILEGVIGANCYFNTCTALDKTSITSIINALSNTTNGLSLSLSKTAVDSAFEEVYDRGDGSWTTEWSNLVATKPNWTISLV